MMIPNDQKNKINSVLYAKDPQKAFGEIGPGEQFTTPLHKIFYKAMKGVYDSGEKPSLVKTSQYLIDSGIPDLVPALSGLLEDSQEVKKETATEKKETSELERLAALSPIEYDKVRVEVAKGLKVRTSTLDSEVDKLRQKDESTLALFGEIEPWPEEVDGAGLLNEIRDIINSHLIIAPRVDIAVTLWVVLTYCFDSFRILPLLGITSPEKRCGKTTFAEVLQGLVCNAVNASNISSAVLYRLIEKHRPTLMVDEADTFLPDNDELRGVFNAGHTKKSANVWRCNNETNEPEQFSVWGPKVVLMIGNLPSTMDDRSIRVRMRRKAPGERVNKLTLDFEDDHLPIRQKITRWASDNPLLGAEPDTPNVGNDRASDNWLPLLAIADKAGDDWPELARSSMLILEQDVFNEADSAGQMLLADIQTVFEKTGTDRIFSDNLVDQLTALEDRPWCEWRRGNPITQSTLSKLLKPFGIRSKQLRSGTKNRRGYQLERFKDSFKRYLPPFKSSFQGVTVKHTNNISKLGQKQSDTKQTEVTLQKELNYPKSLDCNVVTLQNPDMGEMDRIGRREWCGTAYCEVPPPLDAKVKSSRIEEPPVSKFLETQI